jgi:hypothetical protein
MFAQDGLSAGLILRECPDRRKSQRLSHRQTVEVNGRRAMGRDISSKGLSVVMTPSVSVGDTVRVSLSGSDSPTTARVRRVVPQAGRCIVGLEFVG